MKSATFVELLRQRAARTPNQQAYEFLLDGETDSDRITYAELDRRAKAIAAWLQSRRALGERALLLYPPGLEYIAAFFGCLYAGVIAVPAYPPQRKRGLPRVQAMALDSQAAYVLTTSSIHQTIERLAGQEPEYQHLVALQWFTTDKIVPELERDWHEPNLTTDTLAFLQYTSGSTGMPKGVMVSHGNLLHNERLIQEAFGHTQQELIVGWLPLYHDMGLIGNVLQPLYLGVPCVLMSPPHFLQKPVRWLSAISRYRATTSGSPNFAYDLCVRQISEAQRVALDLSSWTIAFNGAEPIRPSTLERFADTFQSCGFRREAFYSCYGLAEATLLVTGGVRQNLPTIRAVGKSTLEKGQVSSTESEESDDAATLVGCGIIRSDQQVRIVQPESREGCPDGQVGEIWVNGPSVAQGYWQREGETNETFKAYIIDTNEGPFLRTGDLGFLNKGELFVTGRLKDLIIIRGRNHYPQDIEQTVEESHPALRSGCGAAFSVVEHNEEQLVVVQELEARVKNPAVEAVTAAIRRQVAEQHDVHVSTVVLIKAGTLSKTSSGKVQRRLCRDRFLTGALTVIAESAALFSQDFIGDHREAASTESLSQMLDLEKSVAELWSRVLERPAINRYDDFFALGGDSLRGMQIVGNIQERWQVDLSLDALFDHPSLEEFVAYVQTLPKKMERSAPSEMPQPAQRESAMPLSPAQERFWFLEQLAQGSAINNVPVALRLQGRLDVEALRTALAHLLHRHEVLRSRCVLQNGCPMQVIDPPSTSECTTTDLRAIPQDAREAELRRLIYAEAHRPFDLTEGSLLRAKLFLVQDDEQVLSLTLHHIVTDGWSMGILKQELADLYRSFKDGQASSLPPLPVQYFDVMQFEVASQQPIFERELDYWRHRLEQVPDLLTLPYDYPRPEVQGHRGTRYKWVIPAELVGRVKEMGAMQRSTLFMTLLAAFNLLLFRYSGQTDFCVGTPVANRWHRQSQGLIGCFVNTMALRAELSGNPTLSELLARVKATVLGAHAHHAVPFERVVDELGVAKDVGRTPLFQVMFVLEDRLSDIRQFADLATSRLEVSTGTSVFDLTLELLQRADGSITAWFEYSTDLFTESTIARMAKHYEEILCHIAAGADGPVSEWSMLPTDERQALLIGCHGPYRPHPKSRCMPELFEAQAAKTPDATALVCEGRAYTYASLDAHANQCARLLRRWGVGPETRVGLCLHRSFEMIVGLLGCLKAGAAYLPIDPSYPEERKAVMVEDGRPAVILTQQSVADSLPRSNAFAFALDSQWEQAASLSADNVPSWTHPENAAYILYTSGTTGRPKGTVVSHRAMVNHVAEMVHQYALTPEDRVLQFASVSFDVALEECFPTWLAGATVVLRPSEPLPAYSDFHAFLHAHRLTVLNLPTPYWAGWTEDLEQTGTPLPPELRLVVIGSEKAWPNDLRRWRRVSGNAVGWCNSYGPTEATVTASVYHPDTNTDWLALRTIPIGRPIANVQLYILDAFLQPVPLGVPGDLYIGGLGLARGYHHLPAMTAEVFIPHPFAVTQGERLYRTGDRACRRADGNVEFLGRRDDQIKIRGFRVELADIEAHTRQHPQVKDARVFLESASQSDWMATFNRLSEQDQEQLIREIEAIPATEAQWLCDMESDAEERRKTVIQRKPEFDVYLKINKGEFLTPPRANQRNWLLRRALDEFSDDLLALDDLAKRFVSGSDRISIEREWTGGQAQYTSSELIIEGQQVMQDWETPLMRAMARIVTESQGDVLEVGFGMGISASAIQEGQPRSHSIIECNRQVMEVFAEWRNRYPGRDIRLVEGKWQDVVDNIGPFDGVFFDTYPSSEAEFEESVINSINFAEAFIPVAAKLLHPGGCLSYYTNEIDSFSRRHQRFLLQHFSSFTLSVVRSLLPPDDCHYWWADSMAVVKAVK
ncbi:MAG: amino acid adenylation domain-containing protein [Nitrospira sp.]|nr:amino acid adenylation domain-containing protein [Nitrospira sp.]